MSGPFLDELLRKRSIFCKFFLIKVRKLALRPDLKISKQKHFIELHFLDARRKPKEELADQLNAFSGK